MNLRPSLIQYDRILTYVFKDLFSNKIIFLGTEGVDLNRPVL